MSDVRITDQTTDSALAAGDYIIIDSESEGTRKFDIGTEITEIKSDLDNVDGISEDVKQALLQIASKVAYIDSGGQDYYDALYDAFYPDVSSITCVYTQSGAVYSTTSLDSLKSDLVVTAVYSDSSTATLEDSDYSLSGTLSTGTSTVTVTYGNYTTTFSVTVTGVVSIDAVYTQSGTVSDTDDLSVLISDLVVTATLSDSSTFTVSSSDYTLSGTLEGGTSTITVTYGTLTTTFDVTVTEVIDYTSDPLDGITWYDGYSYNTNTGEFTATTSEYCTDKFTAVYNCIYTFTNSSSSNTYPAIFAWDGDGNYLGYSQSSLGLYSLKKGYSYAVKAYNASTFDSSTITLLPTDNSSTAVSEFSINLADYIGSISGNSNYYEISISSAISAAGLSTSNWATSINKCNYLAYIAYSGSTTRRFTGADFTFWFYNINTLLFRVNEVGTNDVDALETYLESNPITITFNEGVS